MLFSLHGKELENFLEWDEEHRKDCSVYNSCVQTAIGGRLTFSFTSKGLGTVCSVKCACGEKNNCTDFDSW